MTSSLWFETVAVAALWGLTAGLVVALWPPLWDAAAARYVASLARRAEVLGYPPEAVRLGLRAWGIGLVAVPVAFGYGLGLPLFGLAAVGVLAWLPFEVIGSLVERRERTLRDQLPAACVSLANKGRSRLALRHALAELARDTPDPLRREFRAIAHALRANRTLHDALTEAKTRLNLDCFSVLCELLLLNAASGGHYPAALDALAAALREEQRLERLLASETSSGRTEIKLMGIGLIVMLLGYRLFDAERGELLFSTFPGQLTVLAMMGLALASFLTARSVTRTPR